MEGAKIRSRAKWIEHGEKNSKYFCNLENNNFISKSMSKLATKNGQIVDNQEEIMETVKSFYKSLYSYKEACDVNLNDIINTTEVRILKEQEKILLEGNLTEKECLESLKCMKHNKSPGLSGFTVEFFKFFWADIGQFLVRSLNCGLQKGELSISQKQGIITCIPKANRDKTLLNNWRPISLLNVSYKIASSAIANRLKKILDLIISEDQTGFVANRYIGENTRIIYDIMFYTEKYNLPGLLLLIDFEKAFDSVAWSFINKVLDFFNFGPIFKRWISTFYKNIESCCLVNGHCSEWFVMERGCRQGDPISPYIFILCAEVLGMLIRQNHNIAGIRIENFEYKISQYADDTSLILDGTETSLLSACNVLKFYAQFSGLNINIEKTKAIWIGSKRDSKRKLLPHLNISWETEFTLLGITFSSDLSKIINLNYDKKLEEIKQLITKWSKRILTPLGKITVLKTLALPKINHLILALPNPRNETIINIQKMFSKFLWEGKPGKIKEEVIYNDYQQGGLRMVNVKIFINALKSSWIRKMILRNKKSLLIGCQSKNLKNLHVLGAEYINIKLHTIDNPFWKDVYTSYYNFMKSIVPNNTNDVKCTHLFYNNNIKVGGKFIYRRKFVEKGVYSINDLLNKNGTFYTFTEFVQTFGHITNYLDYASIVSSVKTYLKRSKCPILVID